MISHEWQEIKAGGCCRAPLPRFCMHGARRLAWLQAPCLLHASAEPRRFCGACETAHSGTGDDGGTQSTHRIMLADGPTSQ